MSPIAILEPSRVSARHGMVAFAGAAAFGANSGAAHTRVWGERDALVWNEHQLVRATVREAERVEPFGCDQFAVVAEGGAGRDPVGDAGEVVDGSAAHARVREIALDLDASSESMGKFAREDAHEIEGSSDLGQRCEGQCEDTRRVSVLLHQLQKATHGGVEFPDRLLVRRRADPRAHGGAARVAHPEGHDIGQRAT